MATYAHSLVGMFDAAATTQALVGYDRELDGIETLTPVNESQVAYLDWYQQNWQAVQQVGAHGYICDDEVELGEFLALHADEDSFFSTLDGGGLGLATVSDLSGGLLAAQSTHIVTGKRRKEKVYKGLRVEVNAAAVYYVPGLAYPLVRVPHTKGMDLWLAIPNTPFARGADIEVFQFAVYAMHTKTQMYDAAARWAYIEVPEVRAVLYYEGLWLGGLRINNRVLERNLQVCSLEISQGSMPGPVGVSESAAGLPALSFNTDFVVWTSHLNDQLVSSVVNVPAEMWESV